MQKASLTASRACLVRGPPAPFRDPQHHLGFFCPGSTLLPCSPSRGGSQTGSWSEEAEIWGSLSPPCLLFWVPSW